MMRLAGFEITKISGEKLSRELNELKVETSLNIKDIKEEKEKTAGEEALLAVSFVYSIDYTKEIANVIIEGKIFVFSDADSAKDTLSSWKKRELKDPFKLALFNSIMNKANIEAIKLEDELGLPTHFQFPRFSSPGSKPKEDTN